MTTTASTPLPAAQRTLITVGIMAATIMQVLDQTIANVALPHMQASLGATQESVAWVLTSYIVASAIAIPLTGWLAGRLGIRMLFVAATVGFTLSSMACGLAGSLTSMVMFRALQGIFGAFLVPLSQAVMLDIYPHEKHAQAMTIWSMGVMVAPILGPVLGGWLTDSMDWRWVFFINVPIGVLAITMIMMIPDHAREPRRFDMIGFGLLAVALSALQIMLDRGSQLDWFDSWEIRIELGVAIAAGWMFIVHMCTTRVPLMRLELFKDRNFMLAQLLIMVTSGLMVAGAVLIAPMLQRLLGYNATDAGFATMPRGVGVILSMLVVGRLIKHVDGRLLITLGMLINAYSLWLMAGFSLEMDRNPVIVSGLIQGIGIGLVVVPLNLIAFTTLGERLRTDGAAVYSLSRNIGASIAISITTALIARNVQISHSDLSTHFTAVSLPWLNTAIAQQLGAEGASVLAMLDLEINRQALMIAYIDDFYLMLWATLAAIPLIALMRRSKNVGSMSDAMAVAD